MTLADALAYFVTQGWTPAQAAGIVANLQAESGLRPDAAGDGGQAYGIAQWHHDRQVNFAAVIGKDIHGSSVEDQLAFVHAELNGAEKAAGHALRDCTNAADAGACVSKMYERPADREGEAAKRASLAQHIYAQYAPPTAQDRPIQQPRIVQPGTPMLPLIAALAPMVIQAIPQIAKLFMPAPTTEVAARNQAAAQIALDTIASATGSVNWQEGVQKITDDPAARKVATEAVLTQPEIMGIMEVGGGIVAARENDLKVMASDKPFWKASAVFWVSVMLMPLVYWLVGSLIVGGLLEKLAASNIFLPSWSNVLLGMFGGGWTGEARSGGFNLVVGLVLGGICGVYFGVSVTQGKTGATSPTGQQQP